MTSENETTSRDDFELWQKRRQLSERMRSKAKELRDLMQDAAALGLHVLVRHEVQGITPVHTGRLNPLRTTHVHQLHVDVREEL